MTNGCVLKGKNVSFSGNFANAIIEWPLLETMKWSKATTKHKDKYTMNWRNVVVKMKKTALRVNLRGTEKKEGQKEITYVGC